MEFSKQEYCSGLPSPSPGDLPNPRIKPASPVSPALQADSLPTEPSGKSWNVFGMNIRFYVKVHDEKMEKTATEQKPGKETESFDCI